MWTNILPILENHTHFIITAHVNPDCDALGSELALAELLRTRNKQVTIINSDPTPVAFRFLDPQNHINRFSAKKHTRLIKNAEVIVVLDASGGWSRLGPVGSALEKAGGVKLCIDHHPDPTDFVNLAVVDTQASATAELIFDLVQTMGGVVSPQMAQALYAAIVTDTGSFRFPKTSPRTHQIAAQLLAAGADPLYIYSQIYEQNSLGAVRLRGHVLASIKTAARGQIAYYTLTKQTLNNYGVKTSELDGFASLGQQIGGVRVTLFCMEASGGRVKISLRSDGSVAVNDVAQAYGGGGHPSAAGALVDGTLDDVLAAVLKKITARIQTQK
ncbi:MAG: bifunctional oligoribonuclease/PAP phosphatase NrnA [Chloroflexi bacterium]|nr:MAG: bifunctional oligoribonuclease/PAP phosphatase NrnA [Chloroflexota bacterium]